MTNIFTGRNEVVAKVMFLLGSVILSTGEGGLPQCMLRYHPPPGRRHPLGRKHPKKETPLGRRPPEKEAPASQERHPLKRRHPPRKEPPPPQKEPPPKGDPPLGIWSMSDRYASYWNAFLLQFIFCWPITGIFDRKCLHNDDHFVFFFFAFKDNNDFYVCWFFSHLKSQPTFPDGICQLFQRMYFLCSNVQMAKKVLLMSAAQNPTDWSESFYYSSKYKAE